MRLRVLLLLFVATPCFISAQTDKKKDAGNKNIWNVELKGAYDVPFADMATRFGNSFRLGFGLKYKTDKNWVFGIEHSFIVGGKVKETGLLENLYTDNGGIINEFGEVLNVGIFQRGYMTGIQVGKILPVWNKIPNSGLSVQTGVGFMQYKINLFDRDNNLGALKNEYRKGYDRLTNGMYVKQFVGYTHYSPNKLINYVVGIDGIVGFNQGRRDYLFDVNQPGNMKRTDILIGLSAAWIIPLYRKITEETYY